MRSSAIKKATRRIRQAKDALPTLIELQRGVRVDDFEQSWFEFLGTLNSIPEILKTGSRENPQSRQWFAAKERLVRKDPLLRYLFHARAVDFHGDTRLLKLRTSAGDPEDIDYGLNDTIDHHRLNLSVPAHMQKMVIWYEMQPVKDLNNNVFNPPTEHLQGKLFDTSPVGLARTAIAFYERLLGEAKSLSA